MSLTSSSWPPAGYPPRCGSPSRARALRAAAPAAAQAVSSHARPPPRPPSNDVTSRALEIPTDLRQENSLETAYTNVVTISDMATLFSRYKVAISINLMLCLFRLFRSFSVNPRLDLVAATISSALVDLAHFLVVFATIVGVYSLTGYILFGHVLSSYKTLWFAANTLLRMSWFGEGAAPPPPPCITPHASHLTVPRREMEYARRL